MRIFLISLLASTAALAAGVPYFTQPALCPTRPEIAFVSGGDIWVVAAKGGEAHLLVSHPADQSRPLYSPDGNRLAFVSTRTGGGDIYVLSLSNGDLMRLTFEDGMEQLDAWSRDGKWIYFSSGAHDVGGKNDIYRVSAEGGTPMPVSADRFTNEFQGAPSPDGSALAFAARGNGDQQWWRHGHAHLDESEIWIRKDNGSYQREVDLNGRNAWPMWMPGGKQIYFMSDRSGAQNIWTLPMGAKMKQVTKFNDGRVLWPSIGYDGKGIVFERDFKIWQLDTKNGEAYALPITLVGSSAIPTVSHLTLNTFTDLALSADGKKIAVVGHGEVFAAPAKEGGQAVRVTHTPGPESAVEWSPDSTRVAYLSQRDAITHVFVYDFLKHAETQLSQGAVSDQGLRFSPDGKSIAFVRGKKELRVVDIDSKQERLIISGFIGGNFGPSAFAWSPDSKWLVYANAGAGTLRNIYVVPAAGGEGKQISFLANTNVNSIQWSPDGKFVLYETGQRTETPDVARIDLTPRQPDYTEQKFDDLFKPEPTRQGRGNAEAKPPLKPVQIDFNDIKERISMLPIGLSVNQPQISPDGKWLLFSANVGGQVNLYLYPLDAAGSGRGGRGGRGGEGESRGPRQLTSTPGPKNHAHFTSDSKEVFYLEAGRVQTITIDNRQSHAVNVNAEMDVDFNVEKMAVFEEAWAGQRDNYYDPKFHGADWNAVRKMYAPLIEGARTPDEMRAILRLMIGELNSSHSGISAPASPGGRGGVVGQLGLSFDRAAYESAGKLKVTEVVPHSPAELAKIQPGDELQAVDGVAVGPRVNLNSLLEHKIDKRVELDVNGKEVIVRPVASLRDQVYRKWVEDNRAYVAKISNGKLGYVHIRDMSEQALTQLYLDLDAENRARSGVVIDIRNNNGGFVNAMALDVLTRKPYLTMTNRDGIPGSARTVLGQRSLELPTILVVNQHSLSDAEDFTEGYRTLKLGKVVGEPTAGWIIYTGSMDLVDGTVMRQPGTLVQGSDGKDMELHPRPVDIAVSRPIGESYTGKDSQLDAAVKELMAEVEKK
jgi:Tol biopolymer transport system component